MRSSSSGHGKAVIFDSHEFYSLLIQEKGYIPGFLKKPASRIYGALEAGVFQKLDAVIIPCTSFGKTPFEKCAKRTVIVDNLPDAGRFPPPEKLYPDAENTVGYVGGVTAERGITNLIRACAHRRGAAASGRSRLAGVSRRAEENAGVCVRGLCRCRSVCRGAGILPSFFRRLRNAFKYPPVRLHRTILPTKVYEYMGAGLPSIVSDTLSARELEEKFGCCVCVDPDKPEEIAAAIRSLLDDPERRAAMGERGYSALQTRFNWQTEEKKLLALYEELLPLKGE